LRSVFVNHSPQREKELTAKAQRTGRSLLREGYEVSRTGKGLLVVALEGRRFLPIVPSRWAKRWILCTLSVSVVKSWLLLRSQDISKR
jgi:hypothetical protein